MEALSALLADGGDEDDFEQLKAFIEEISTDDWGTA